ncbi:glycosyltransferase family 4 protein [Pseudoneobacillus sp. C159]
MNKSEWKRNTLSHSYTGKGLRILLLTWEYPPHIVGGLARHAEGLSVYLHKYGCEVYVLTTDPLFNSQPFFHNKGVKVYRTQPLNAFDPHFLNWIGGLNLSMTKKGLELAQLHHFDVVHAHDWLVGEAAQSLSRILKIPLMTTIHGTEYGRNSGIYTEMQQFIHDKEVQLIQASNRLIVCSEYMRDEVKGLVKESGDKITVIPNGVQIENINLLNNIHPILMKEKRKIIFSIGRLVKEKGFDLIIEAAAQMKCDDFCFVIAGIGPLYHDYEILIRRYGLEGHVYLTGFLSDYQRDQFFSNCTLAVFPSRYEPFGIVALEALKFKKPIIVGETGGLKGIIKHLETGLFMNPGNVHSLIEQIKYILDNPFEAQKMAELGGRFVDTYFSWKKVAEQTNRQYEELVLLSSINEPISTN